MSDHVLPAAPDASGTAVDGPPRAVRDDPGLGRQVRSGALWSSLSTVVLKLSGLVVGILAARLLSPADFGIFAVALTVHAIVINVSDLGVSAYLVRHDGDIDEAAPTVTTIALVTSAVLAAVMMSAAPVIARELGAVEAADAVRALSITVVLAGVSAVPNAILIREFRQDKRFAAESASFVTSTAVLIPLALAGFGAMALAWSRVAGHVVSTTLFIVLSRRFYAPRVNMRQLALLVAFGLPLVGNTLLGFAISNLDYVVVGRMLGAEALGAYYLAYNLASWPFMLLSPVLAGVALAAFARLRASPERLASAITGSLSVALAVAMPLSAVLVFLPVPLIESVYGSKWAATAGPLMVIALYGALRVPVDVLSNAAIALGRTRQLLACQLAYCVALAPLMVVLVSLQGVVGAALAHLLAIGVVLLPCSVWVVARGQALRPTALLIAASRPTLAAGVAGAAAWFSSLGVGGSWAGLLLGLTAGGTVYLLLMRTWWTSLRRTYTQLVGEGSPELMTPAEPRETS